MVATRTVTVLVADVAASTELFAGMGADKADNARRLLFDAFEAAVETGDGVLIKTMGDGCLASFTAAASAVTAAVAMQQRAASLRAHRVPGLGLRVGLAVGDVTEEDGDIFGPAVVTASRLCDAASSQQVLATEMVRMLAGDRGGHRYEAAGELILKGIAEPVAACRVEIEASDAGPVLPSPLAGTPNELVVGRGHEAQVLSDAYKDAAAGERRAVLVAGEPGIGKTRLVAAASRRAHDDGALVLFGRCEEGLAVPYQPFAQALQGAVADLDPAVLNEHVAVHGGELSRLVPGVGVEPVRADPTIEQARLFDAVIDLLRRVAAERPVLLVLDDLHWAAPATIALLRHILSGPADYALCVFGTYRDTEIDRTHALGGLLSDMHRTEGTQRLALRGLDLDALEDLLVAVSGDALDDDGRALASAVATRTAGNPFFVNQVLRHLVERGALVQEGGRWNMRGGTGDIDLPEGVLDVVGRRLSRLSPAANEAMRVAAVCGLGFNMRVLCAVPDAGGPDAVVDGIDEALRARLLVETAPGQLAFAHAIVRDALLRELSTARAARLHRAVGEAILSIFGDAPSRPLAELARHFTEAAVLGDTATAATWATRAAAAASAQADHRGGIAVLERALAVIEAVEPVNEAARFDVAVAIAEAHYLLAEDDTAGINTAADAARQLRSGERMLRVAAARYPGGTGIADPQRLELFQEAVDLLPEDATPLRFLARAAMAGFRALAGDPTFADDLDDLLAELDEVTVTAPRVSAVGRSWLVFAMLGLPGAARRLALTNDGFDIPDDTPDPWFDRVASGIDMMRFLEAYRGHAMIGLGRRDEFEAVVRELHAASKEIGNMSSLGMSSIQFGLLAHLDGRFDDATRHAEEMLAASPEDPNFLMSYFAIATRIAIDRGRANEAVPMIDMVKSVSPELTAAWAASARIHFDVGESDLAAEEVGAVLARWSTAARDWSWPLVLADAAEAVAGLGDRDAAGLMLDEISAYSGELGVVGAAIFCVGAYDRYRGMLLDTLGRHDEAVAALEAALALESAADAPVLTARTRYWLAVALRHRAGPGDVDAADVQLSECIATADRLGMTAVATAARQLLD